MEITMSKKAIWVDETTHSRFKSAAAAEGLYANDFMSKLLNIYVHAKVKK